MTHRMLLDLPSHLETERLRPFESDNVLMEIETQEHAEIIARLMAADWVQRSAFFLGLWEKSGEAWAGQVYVGPVDWTLPEFEIGCVEDVDHEGRGFVTEAVQAHRVSLRCDDTNTRSVQVAERCGFTCEAHQRENKRRADAITGTHLYALLRRDYEVLR